MRIDDLFPDDLSRVIEDGFILRLVGEDEQLKMYKIYYFPEFDQKVKCIGVEHIDDNDYYFLKNDSFQCAISYPIDYRCYALTKDKYNMMKRNIINTNYSYMGFQIRWWFYIHNCSEYSNFIKLLDTINDHNTYKVFGKFEGSKFVDCKFVLKTREE